jgi:branched-chain amino acid transport system substrate-binding protein
METEKNSGATPRRGFLKTAAAAVVGLAVGAVGGYFAGSTSAPAASVTTAATTVTTTITPTPKTTLPEKTEIVFGNSDSLTGGLADVAGDQERGMDLWMEQCNAVGGIMVAEYGQRLPVKRVVYDDQGVPDNAVKLYEKLITVDNVDCLAYSYGTWMTAIQPVIEQYKHPLVAGTSLDVEELKTNYLFFIADRTPTHAFALADLMDQIGKTKAAVEQLDQEFGVEYWKYLEPEFNSRGIQVVSHKTHPLTVTDMTSDLLEVKSAISAGNCDAVILLGYPPDDLVFQRQLIDLAINPGLVYGAFNVFAPSSVGMFGWDNMNGMCGFGESFLPKMKTQGLYCRVDEWFQQYVTKYGRWPDYTQSLENYKSLEVHTQAIERAGTLDREAVRKELASGRAFTTVCGGAQFLDPPDRAKWSSSPGPTGINNINMHPIGGQGVVNQWQLQPGAKPDDNWLAAEIVSPRSFATAKPLYPKPNWHKS